MHNPANERENYATPTEIANVEMLPEHIVVENEILPVAVRVRQIEQTVQTEIFTDLDLKLVRQFVQSDRADADQLVDELALELRQRLSLLIRLVRALHLRSQLLGSVLDGRVHHQNGIAHRNGLDRDLGVVHIAANVVEDAVVLEKVAVLERFVYTVDQILEPVLQKLAVDRLVKELECQTVAKVFLDHFDADRSC